MSEIKIHCKHDEIVDPNKLKNHPKNRNKHGQDQIDRLAELYKYHGIRHPIIVSNLSNCIVAGHGRKLAAIRAGIKEMPVVYQDFDSSEAEYAFIQADNAIALWAELDLSGINTDLAELGPDFDINMLGIRDFTLDMSDKEFEGDPDEVPEVVEPVAKLGQIYRLGDHRLMCGDSTDEATVAALMDGEKADMVFTDPPYGMDLDTDYSKLPAAPNGAKPKKDFRKVAGDSEDFSPELIKTVLHNFSYTKEIFMFGADYYAEHLEDKNSGSWIVWDKRVTEAFDKMIGSAFELCWSKAKHKREIARFNNTLFSGESDAKNKVHPTQKPIKLIEWFFEKWGSGLSNVVDLFGGSGSTLIACEKTNRKCFMMELDPHYVSVIVERWRKFTGKEAYLLNDDGTETPWESLCSKK